LFNIYSVKKYRLILYKLIEDRWHYVRLSAREDGLSIENGVCGLSPTESEQLQLQSGADLEKALRLEGSKWAEKGYGKPPQQQLHVMTLHFQMRRWTGYPAGAPWYDDWTTGYLDPVLETLDATCNGIPRGNERFSGNYLHHYVVFNTDLAMEAVEKVAAAAPVKFLLDIHVGRREKQVQIPIDPNVPEYLRSLFRIVEKSARSIASELPTLFPGDPLQPELLVEKGERKRISGNAARFLREELKEKWNFNSNFWDPLLQAAPSEVVFLNGMAEDKKQAVANLLEQKVVLPFYLLDCEEGLFEISRDQIFAGAHEGMVFDASLDWVIYFSHHYTITFSGNWLIQEVKKLYKGEEDKLNNW
jgi:hypothetical protein